MKGFENFPQPEAKKPEIPASEIIDVNFEEIPPDKTKEPEKGLPAEEKPELETEAIKKSLSPEKVLDRDAEKLALREEFNRVHQEYLNLYKEITQTPDTQDRLIRLLITEGSELKKMRARMAELGKKIGIKVSDGFGNPV